MLGILGVELTLVVSPFSGAESRPASLSPPGPCAYQCATTKSTEEQAIGNTVSFQGCGEEALVCPSGQLPGAVSTSPVLMVGSTAFMAWLKATTLLAYVAGPNPCVSYSHVAP